MLYDVLGKTGLKVSKVGFGGIPIQRVTREEAIEIVLKAMDLGINFIDTARRYGVSEEFIGDALKGNRDRWIVASKSMERTAEGILKDVDISLKNLQTDYIDLYQIHNVKTLDAVEQVLADDGALYGLLKAKEMGKIKHIGVTAHSMDALDKAIESGYFETIMYPYSIVENQAEKLFEKAHEKNIGVLAMKPMAGGNLTDGDLAIRYILQNKNVTIALPGMAGINEVEQNALAAINFRPLNEEELKKCREIAEDLGETFCRRCGYCAPCTKGIDIPFSFIVNLYYNNYDLKEWATNSYKGFKAHASDCIECGQCEVRCPYNLPIRKMLKNVRNTFGY